MLLEPIQYLSGAVSGCAVGFSLGLFGGGGSILAVPLLVYVVGVQDIHVAIGTSAFCVAVNALAGLASHARHGTVRWRAAMLYSGAGIAGAFAGATVGKAVDGQRLLLLFAGLMAVIGVRMLRQKASGRKDTSPDSHGGRSSVILAAGAGTGILSGFFGIGGGFLIVPVLMSATGMAMLNAVGTSLVAISAFGLTTAANYSLSGLIDWPLAGAFMAGGAGGAFYGCKAAVALSRHRSRLTVMFGAATLIMATGLAVQSLRNLMS